MHVFRGRRAVVALFVAVVLAAVSLADGEFCLFGQHNCDIHATCTLDATKPTGYVCTCKPDYQWDANTQKCVYMLCLNAKYALQNGGLEEPNVMTNYNANHLIVPKAEVPNWKSTEEHIELWQSGFISTPSDPTGRLQFAEIQAYNRSTLFQDITSVPGTKLQFEFPHRGRDGTDTVAVIIGPATPAVPTIRPTCEEYEIVGKTSYTLFQTGKMWKRYTVGPYTVPAGQNVTRVMFCAKAQATTCESCGNLVDEVELKSPQCYVDPCTTGGHNCNPNAHCIHGTNGNYTCQCNTGYIGNGYQCFNPDACKGTAYDMLIMMDATRKITGGTAGESNWKAEIDFIRTLANQPMFELGADLTHAGLVYYGTRNPPVAHIPMNSLAATNVTRFQDRLSALGYPGPTGNTGLQPGAITTAADQFTLNPRNVPKFMILISAGIANPSMGAASITAEAHEMRANGISIIGIGVGSDDASNLSKYGICPPELALTVTSWNTLPNVIGAIMERVCEGVPRNGGWGDWSVGPCDATCGSGLRTQTRLCNRPYPNAYGALCSTSSDPTGTYTFESLGGISTLQHASSDQCSAPTPCPINCVMSQWSDWAQCNATCNRQSEASGGLKSRTRTILSEPQYNGTTCLSTVESSICTKIDCPVDCAVSDWSAWATCDAVGKCNASDTSGVATGLESRTRVIIRQPNSITGALACPSLSETQSCSYDVCPINCQWGDWSPGANCDAASKCDQLSATASGTQTATRVIKVQPNNGGSTCDGDTTMTSSCSKTDCPVDCRVTGWSGWSTCTAEKSCPADRDKCPLDCVQTQWTNWDTCTATCKDNKSTANGIIARSRDTTRNSANGGVVCGETTESMACSIQCAVDCTVSNWSEWVCDAQSKCNRKNELADGTQTRTCPNDITM